MLIDTTEVIDLAIYIGARNGCELRIGDQAVMLCFGQKSEIRGNRVYPAAAPLRPSCIEGVTYLLHGMTFCFGALDIALVRSSRSRAYPGFHAAQ